MVFSTKNMEHLQLKTVSVLVFPPHVVRGRNMNKNHKIVNKDWQSNILDISGRCGLL